MKINVGKNDICYTCAYGKEEFCAADVDDIFFDDTGNISDCRCYKAKEAKPKRKRFVKPTVEEIAEYISERGYTHTNPEAVFDHYESVGWMVGKSPMKDWKKAVNNWERRQVGYEKEKLSKLGRDKMQCQPTYDLSKIDKETMWNTEIK